MTLEFAKKEAARRTEVLGTTHLVVKSLAWNSTDEYLVTTELPTGYVAVAVYTGKEGNGAA